MTLDEELKSHGWIVNVDEESGSLRVISTRLRQCLVIVPRGSDNSITLAHVKPTALSPSGRSLSST